MHNNTQTPEDIRGYSVYAIYGVRHDGPTNSNTSIVCYDADRAYAEYLHKIKVSKLDAVVLEAWNKDAADDRILRNEPTKHALKKGVSKCRFAPSASTNAVHCTTPLTG